MLYFISKLLWVFKHQDLFGHKLKKRETQVVGRGSATQLQVGKIKWDNLVHKG